MFLASHKETQEHSVNQSARQFLFKDLFMCFECFPVCMYACTYVHHECAWCLWRSEEDVGTPGAEVADGYHPLVGTGN